MDERLKPAYDMLMGEIDELRKDINEKTVQLKMNMALIDKLLIKSGEQPQFGDNSEPADSITVVSEIVPIPPYQSTGMTKTIKQGMFYNRPLAKSVRHILEMNGGTMLFDDIITGLRQGGFDAKDEKWVRNTMLKNKHFALLPDKRHFIYVPKGKPKKGRKSADQESQTA